MAWSTLAAGDVPFHVEVRDGVTNGYLEWESSEPSWSDGDDHTYTASEFLTYIRNSGGPIFNSADDPNFIMFKDEWTANAITGPIISGFSGIGDTSSEVDLSWSDNSGGSANIDIQNADSSGGTFYDVVTGYGASNEAYHDTGPRWSATDRTYYRWREASTGSWSSPITVLKPL